MSPGLVEDAPGQTRVLITAAEVFPEMERAFLEAEVEVWASYRVFDLWTKLRSDEAREIGTTWFDLIVHTLRRGVAIHMALSDFDPVMAPALHHDAWRSMRAFLAAREVAGPKARLHLTAATHPARIGRPQRLLFWPWVRRRLVETVEDLNDMDAGTRAKRLAAMPGLRRHLDGAHDGPVRAKKWPPADLLPVTHHQKIAVFDRKRLCVGGLDLNERRYDDPTHSRRRDETWHDVQVMIDGGTEVAEAQAHLETFLRVTDGQIDPPPAQRLLSTLSRKRKMTTPFIGPRPIRRSLKDVHHARIKSAKRLIYLETQFFRDTALSKALCQAAHDNPELGLIMILPAAPEDVAFDGATSSDARFGEYLQARAIDRVAKAFGDRAVFCSPVRPVAHDTGGRDCFAGSPIIYVHAKVSIFDTDRAVVSSANLNGRSMNWDTEAGVELVEAGTVMRLRKRVFCHWLQEKPDNVFMSPDTAVAAWRKRAEQNLAAAPDARKGFIVPYDPTPARNFGRAAPGMPEALV
ncbi:hypothetical protein A8B78_11850 [Jannaschia sp. EhC01]|nr:hypothetical protein A8B78_11850 [Jannaschia sp. EhC01]